MGRNRAEGAHAETPKFPGCCASQFPQRREPGRRRRADAGRRQGASRRARGPISRRPLPGPSRSRSRPCRRSKDPVTQTSSGGDFMVDVLKTLDIEYLRHELRLELPRPARGADQPRRATPSPRSSPARTRRSRSQMAQGYAKIEGKPMAVMCHGVVGLQHASMALYNAWCDRVPVYRHDRQHRRGRQARARAPNGCIRRSIRARIVRDFVKWDDQPASLQHFAESAVRAYKIAMTPPMGPVLLSLDAELQENPIADREGLRIPKLAQGGAAAGRFRRGRRTGARCWWRPKTRSWSATAWRARPPA